MPQHRLNLTWDANKDQANYHWSLESGTQIRAITASGEEDQEYLDPEDAFIGAVASCHLLSFVTEAARDGFVVSHYEDQPVGLLVKDEEGRLCVGKVLLTPKATFAGDKVPNEGQINELHSRARRKCIISNSVKSEIILEPLV